MLHRPRTLSQAIGLLADGEGLALAGGTDIFPALVDRPSPTRMIDLTGIAGMKDIVAGPDGTRFGAGCTWTDILKADLPRGFGGLMAAARELGSVQIPNRATIGGNLCNASPAADGVPALLALDAEVELFGSAGRRHMRLADFVLGNRKTARRPDEIMVAVLVPASWNEAGSAFSKLGARRYLVISIVMVAANIVVAADGRVDRASIAVGAASAVAHRLTALERRIVGQPCASLGYILLSAEELAALSPIDDGRGTAAYRLQAARVLVGRAIAAAAASATRHAG